MAPVVGSYQAVNTPPPPGFTRNYKTFMMRKSEISNDTSMVYVAIFQTL